MIRLTEPQQDPACGKQKQSVEPVEHGTLLPDPEIQRRNSDHGHTTAEADPGKPVDCIQPTVLRRRDLGYIIADLGKEQKDRDGKGDDDQTPESGKQIQDLGSSIAFEQRPLISPPNDHG